MWPLYKLFFLMTLVLSTLFIISTNSWVSMWIGLEANLLSFIPLLKQKQLIGSSEAAMKYFITQAMASIVILMALLNKNMINSMSDLNINSPTLMFILSALIMKMGAAPFHFWFPEVMMGVSWPNALLLLTWQKIAPMTMIIYLETKWTTMGMVSSILVGSILGLGQTNLRKILAYSSINHMGWMLAALMFSKSIWMMYLIIYCLMNTFVIIQFKNFNLNFLNQLGLMKMTPLSKIVFSMNFLSLGGIPPFIGFLPKWLTIQILIEKQLIIPSIFMIILTIVTLFYYVRIIMMPLVLSTSNFITMKTWMNVPEKKMLIANMLAILSLFAAPMMVNWI